MKTMYQPILSILANWLLCAMMLETHAPVAESPAVKALNFESRNVYHSSQTPGYTSWVSFYSGERGQWYIGCEEVTKTTPPQPLCTQQQFYEMGLPKGYDKSPYLMEAVILVSSDNMKTWKVISRQPYRHHHTVGQFGSARTKDGHFLRFIWSCYSLDPSLNSNEIFYTSDDNGKKWKKMPPFHDEHFASYPHRLRMLRDGTFVLAVPLCPNFGEGSDRPVRIAMNLNAVNECGMSLYFSYDQGKSWNGPLPIYPGVNVSETDYVELPSGDLLCINNSIFTNPGRQIIYRNGNIWTPGPLEKVRRGMVPETVAITEDGILVGCKRAGSYHWSDDLGLTWQPLDGIPNVRPQVYQPWIQYLGNNHFACAGHYGADDATFFRDQNINLHLFDIKVLRKTKNTKIEIERDFDEATNRYKNAYAIILLCEGKPLPDKEMDFWYVAKHQPGYDSWNAVPLPERMNKGGKLRKIKTGPEGIARISLPEFDSVTDSHFSYQFVVRFNMDNKYPNYKPDQSLQYEFYAVGGR